MTGDWLTSLRKLCDNAKNGSREVFFIVKFNLDIDISVIISLVFMSRVRQGSGLFVYEGYVI